MKRELVFGLYMTPQGPVSEEKMHPELLLRTLVAYCEDLREKVLVAKLKRELGADEDKPRIEVVSGAIVGRNGKLDG